MILPAENKDFRWYILQSKLQERKICAAFELFRQEGIEPILIKGWAAALFYPNRAERFFADIDLSIAPESFEKAKKISENESIARLNVDLHSGFRHLDTISWENLYENSRLVKLEETDIRILRPEDHLRVLCVHWLTDGGASKQKLLDIYYAVENRPLDFDWERCLEIVSKKRRRWIVCTIGLAKRYFGLSLQGTPIETEAENLPNWLVKTVESEWKNPVTLKPMQTTLSNKREFFRQIRKRIPPNAIQATIEMEGSFDKNPRIFYQVANMFKRIFPALKRIKLVMSGKTHSAK